MTEYGGLLVNATVRALEAEVVRLRGALTLIRDKSQNWEGDYAEQVLAAGPKSNTPQNHAVPDEIEEA